MKQTQISAEIVAHSINEQGDELISVLATFPRIILAEVNTHRMLSKNTSSSRAIPFAKMVETIKNDPFIPIAWQKEHKGMQGTEYFTDEKQLEDILANYDNARNAAIHRAEYFTKIGVTKQLANRLLEPFMWTTMLITGPKSGWDNFFNLRCPIYAPFKEDAPKGTLFFKSVRDINLYLQREDSKITFEPDTLGKLSMNKGQAEIHMMALAEGIWDAYNESTPKVLKAGEWHIPFEDKMTEPFFKVEAGEKGEQGTVTWIPLPGLDKGAEKWLQQQKVKVSVAMAARTSYTVVGEEKELLLSDFVGGFEYEMKEGFSDGTVKNQKDFEKAKWVPQIYSDLDFPYIERIFNGRNKQNGLFGLRHKQKNIDIEAMVGLHDRLLAQDPPHSSPLEHCCRSMTDHEWNTYFKGVASYESLEGYSLTDKNGMGWCNNIKGFIPYRYIIDNCLTL